MNTDDKFGLIRVVMVVLIFVLGIIVGRSIGEYQTQIEAVKAGCGEFVITNQLRPETVFQWKTNNNIPQLK